LVVSSENIAMKCPRCRQHNPSERRTCWNCGAALYAAGADDAAGKRAAAVESRAAAEQIADADDASDLGTLGPLRLGNGGAPPERHVTGRAPPSHAPVEYGASQFLGRSVIAGAMTGGTAMALLFGVLASAAAGILEIGGVSRNATVLVSIAQGLIAGALNGAIIGALCAYYGGGWWTGARVGAALAAGTWLIQVLLMGTIPSIPAPVAAAAVLVLSLIGAGIGMLIGVVVDSLSPRQY
jgi:hypothetical protein